MTLGEGLMGKIKVVRRTHEGDGRRGGGGNFTPSDRKLERGVRVRCAFTTDNS